MEYCSSWEMIEQAKEELQILEAQHPHRFDYLKLELKSFIIYLESQHNFENNNNMMLHYQYQCSNISLPTTSSATTQASTSRKRKKDSGVGMPETMMRSRNETSSKSKHHKLEKLVGDFKRRNRIDAVLGKAHSCLQKIQELKSTLC